MSAHTPGPWLAVRDPGHFHSLSTVVAGDVAKTNKRRRMQVEVGGWASPAEQEANTRLIAAAPDLLAALIGVVRVADRATDEFDAARAAIEKATSASSPQP